ncbi:transmembrane channel-like protein 6b isoform X3 [Phyllopteryx taeniolatus]|uniref:transmembrane channel-like protein 6b isoform X3 n=1 Tax=Phyllopteryx taeniolatus TaxID=161469 RepID=UPI002AD59A01|nr:transmembrane channel-like protein 6b isoform X3 [Phyllopteryx taeniolatus]
MARNVNFDMGHPLIEAGLESPADEEGVHDSFHQLVAEQIHNEDLGEAFELQQPQKKIDEESRDYVANLFSPGPESSDRRNHGGPVGMQEDERETDPSTGERWSSTTLKILSSMPSRTIGRSRGAIISQYYNRTMQLRRRKQSRPSIQDFSRSARPSIRGYGMETDNTDAEVNKRERLVNNLQNLSVSDRVRMLRAMPLSVAEKNELRRLALKKERRTLSGNQIPCCSRLKYYIIIAARQSWYSWLSFVHSLQLWQVALKRVSGRFGSGVLSYFVFLKTLLFFNIFLFLLTGLFMVLPQAVHPPALSNGRRSFTGLELFTGAGYFSDTVMYYGYYCNCTLRMSCSNESGQYMSVSSRTSLHCAKHLPYKMPLAYFFTIGMAFFVTCIILVYSMSKSFGRSFRIDKSHSILAMKAFCSWDFKVIKKSSVKLMSENICTQLKELLAEVNHQHSKNTLCQKLWRVAVHCLAWAICVASTTACVLCIYYFSEYMHRNLQESSRSVTKDPLLNEASLLALPVVVSCINLLLPIMFHLAAWMEDYESPSVRTYVAIGRNLMLKVSVLGVLCYHWLGRVAADPNSIGLESSVMMNCQAPRRPYRVSQMTTIFITLLCFPAFLGASVCVTYTMWSITPSLSCGPFRELKTMFQAGKRWVEDLEKENPNLSVLARAHSYLVENPLFLFVGAGIFLIVIYFHSQVVDGQRKIIGLLQEQIENFSHIPLCIVPLFRREKTRNFSSLACSPSMSRDELPPGGSQARIVPAETPTTVLSQTSSLQT